MAIVDGGKGMFDPHPGYTVVENPLLEGRVVTDQEKRIMYVPCLYHFVFWLEKDFDKALDFCCREASRRVKEHVNLVAATHQLTWTNDTTGERIDR